MHNKWIYPLNSVFNNWSSLSTTRSSNDLPNLKPHQNQLEFKLINMDKASSDPISVCNCPVGTCFRDICKFFRPSKWRSNSQGNSTEKLESYNQTLRTHVLLLQGYKFILPPKDPLADVKIPNSVIIFFWVMNNSTIKFYAVVYFERTSIFSCRNRVITSKWRIFFSKKQLMETVNLWLF